MGDLLLFVLAYRRLDLLHFHKDFVHLEAASKTLKELVGAAQTEVSSLTNLYSIAEEMLTHYTRLSKVKRIFVFIQDVGVLFDIYATDGGDGGVYAIVLRGSRRRSLIYVQTITNHDKAVSLSSGAGHIGVHFYLGYEDARDFTIRERLKTSAHVNLIYYICVGSIAFCGVIMLIILHKNWFKVMVRVKDASGTALFVLFLSSNMP
ncbi:hypothetical protein PHJA_001715300 [Phtheirospermum japonicum]|uniref:Uncharacterized protein n=1 Tax=Phtheirospermum japonicum TaxID=374723 RepID=A0A830CMW9_9LAMI|nr:hypothetical protein PHJA_001715300 [Phtheirospermum japonicum]